MFTVSLSQLLVPLILFTLYHHLSLDHLVKVVHLFSGIYLCASIIAASHVFRNANVLATDGSSSPLSTLSGRCSLVDDHGSGHSPCIS